MNSVNNYINETVFSFIDGTRSLDSFDEFTATIKAMGIDRAVEIYQQALERYNDSP